MKRSSGFTLMEVLVVLAIIGMAALIAAAVIPLSSRDEESYQTTVEIMGRLRQALLGVPPTHLAGERRYLGYIADMGELPELLGDAKQPAGLWTDRVADLYGAESNLPAWGYTGDETRLWIGWHGPYIEASAGVLRDGWGNPLIFERFDISDTGVEIPNPKSGFNLRIKSLGSDGVLQKPGIGDTGYRADIEQVIRVQDYLGSLAGYTGPEIGSIEINLPSRGKLRTISLDSEDDGYFFSGAGTDALLPMGTRSLRLGAGDKSVKIIVLSLEPTANFTGTLR